MKNTWSPTLGEEIANSISHGLGAAAVLFFIPYMIVWAIPSEDAALITGVSIFAACAFVLYLTSTLYHALPTGCAKNVFRVLDHSAIYLLIAGTYTPFMIGTLKGGWGWSLFGVIWTLAIVGVVLKACVFSTPAWLSTSLYVVMGWLALVGGEPVFSKLPTAAVIWLIIGGLTYTLGVIFFAVDEKYRYAHFVWHLFVKVGTACHIAAVSSLN